MMIVTIKESPVAGGGASLPSRPLATGDFPFRTCKCGNPARPKAGYCWDCHARYMRAWRLSHPMTAEQRLKSNCRSYTKVYIRRGLLVRESCMFCKNPNTEPHHEDYTKPLEVYWLCRQHHLATEGKTERRKSNRTADC